MEGPPTKNGANIPETAKLALEKFKTEAGAIVNEELELFKWSPASQVVYHYTNDVGLRGIVNSGKLWLTDAFSLNDPSELFHGLSVAISVMFEKVKAAGEKPRKDYATQLEDLKKTFQNSAHYFLCSFSEAGDDLGQWRAYAHDGSGYALGFDWKKLEEALWDTASFLVRYNEGELRRVIEKILDCTPTEEQAELMGFQYTEQLSAFRSSLSLALSKHLVRWSLHFKHPAYDNEKEYRFLKIQNPKDSNEIKFRPRNYELIKYTEFDWKSAGDDVLKKIVIGPAADFEKSKRFAKDCLREAGIDLADDAITQSPIPYKPA